ncbi:helix-turn-helix transcriptional regulator [Lacticaseibacillus pantheris]|uniref:helix-turn-helix transcriptional regulator n=1 Tax=Lacticaseibacillus pantheris TaxID=171523 RepID=UPI00265A5567|nr:helix-turn-helix transcriptional regulator [Lacticaseibacillus pantheris]WKF84089.1 helix-turn-helix transcriptional regulator [Lacticaseibacillus pantheris]
MKYPRTSGTVLVNNVLKEMKRQGISQQQLSRRARVSRRTIARFCHNPAENFQINTMKRIADILNVSVDSLYDYVGDPMTFNPDPNGFSPENLAVLDGYVSRIGIQFRYQVYSEQRKMNIETKYARCRRVSFSGNWMFDYYHQPRLTLINYDVDYSRIDVQVDEIKQLYTKIIQATISYARRMGINTIEHQIARVELLSKEKYGHHRGPNISLIREKVLRQEGFIDLSRPNSTMERLRYRV